MLLIPLGHDRHLARRWPVVTTVIVALNVLVYVIGLFVERSDRRALEETLAPAIELYRQDPRLALPPELEKIVPSLARTKRAPVRARTADEAGDQALKQAELDRMATEALSIVEGSWVRRFGYVPANGAGIRLLTYQFLHAGLLHMAFNMWFLWLTGTVIEDRWGRGVFPAFYLIGGVLAGLAHSWSAPASEIPLIGASGAVAACMGAFLARSATARIEMWAWIFSLRGIRFTAPAYVMLPMWLGGEILFGMISKPERGGTAHWAHVGGFLFGLMSALALWRVGVERAIDVAVLDERVQDPRVLEAAALIDTDPAAAVAALTGLTQTLPTNLDLWLELLRAAKRGNDLDAERRAYLRLVELYLAQPAGRGEAPAVDLYGEMVLTGHDAGMPVPLRMRVLRAMDRRGDGERAGLEYEQLHGRAPVDEAGMMALLAHADVALRREDFKTAAELFAVAQASPVPHDAWAGAIDRGLRAAGAKRAPSTRPPSPGGTPPSRPPGG